MHIRILVLAGAVMLSGGVQVRAQMSGPPPAPPVGAKEEPAKALDGLLSDMEFQVAGAAKAMPADKYSFAPAQGIFATSQRTQFDTVRTFVAQVTHLAQANYFFFSWSSIKPDRDVKAIGSITTKDEAVAALEASFVYAHKAIATITPENAFVAIKPIDGFSTRATITAFAAAHGYDHYGQMVEYLRMNGIVPPASAKK
jgi:DinB family protein